MAREQQPRRAGGRSTGRPRVGGGGGGDEQRDRERQRGERDMMSRGRERGKSSMGEISNVRRASSGCGKGRKARGAREGKEWDNEWRAYDRWEAGGKAVLVPERAAPSHWPPLPTSPFPAPLSLPRSPSSLMSVRCTTAGRTKRAREGRAETKGKVQHGGDGRQCSSAGRQWASAV